MCVSEWTVAVNSESERKIIWQFDFMSKHCSAVLLAFLISLGYIFFLSEIKTGIEEKEENWNLVEGRLRNYHNNGGRFILLLLILTMVVVWKIELWDLSLAINWVDIHWPATNWTTWLCANVNWDIDLWCEACLS